MTTAGRNNPCPCGSGKKYKKCCLPKDEAAAAAARPPPPPPAPKPRMPWTIVDEDDTLDRDSNRVVDLIHAGKLDEAEAAAKALLRDYPDVHDGFDRLGMVYEARGDRKRAAEHYRKAVAFMQARADDYDPELIDSIRAQADKLDPPPG
jgi:tetratricopeptide (TPR) repeat protein